MKPSQIHKFNKTSIFRNLTSLSFYTYRKQPPKIEDQGIFSWLKPVLSSKEEELIEKIGLDAVMFLRFITMCRNLFFWLFLIGLGAIGVNIYGTIKNRKEFPKTDNPLKYLSITFLRQKEVSKVKKKNIL